MTPESKQPTAPLPTSGSVPRSGPRGDAGRAKADGRDERLMHHGRKRRAQRQTRRKRQQTAIAIGGAIVLVIALLGLGVFAWRAASSKAPHVAGDSGEKTSRGFIQRALAKSQAAAESVKALPNKEADPLPYIAKWHGLKIRTPIQPEHLTEVGFHQAARDYALHMDPYPKKAETEKIRKTKTTGDHTVVGAGSDQRLAGYYIPMWRNRPGQPDSAIDVGTKPGTAVFAPVDGTVVKVRHYKLYGKLADWEMHIRPDDAPDTDLVIIHIANPTVEIGQRVIGGRTKIAECRRISGIIASQLREFTHTGGDHVHIQLNDTTRKDYKGLRMGDDRGLSPYPGPVNK